MVNYSEGADHCRTNSNRLETTARIILKDEDGTDSFGLFLYHIAYEEMAKAVFCLFVERGWVTKDFVSQIFRRHEAKIFLFEEIFRSFELNKGQGYLGGKKIGEISLEDFMKEHKPNILKHRKKTNDFLYVGNTSPWNVPSVSISNVKDIEIEIRKKTQALDIIFEFLRKKMEGNAFFVNNFQFIENEQGNFSIQWDSA